MDTPTPDALLPLRPADHHILFALLDEPLHGYAVSRQIKEATGGIIALEAANLQRTLRKMTRQGLVEETSWRPAPEEDDPRRRYYAITDLGRRVLARDAERMRRAVTAAEAKAIISRAEVP